MSFIWASPGLGTSSNPIDTVSQNQKQKTRFIQTGEAKITIPSDICELYPSLRQYQETSNNDDKRDETEPDHNN